MHHFKTKFRQEDLLDKRGSLVSFIRQRQNCSLETTSQPLKMLRINNTYSTLVQCLVETFVHPRSKSMYDFRIENCLITVINIDNPAKYLGR